MIKTASWLTELPPDHARIGISRGVPRRMPAGFRMYRKLAPGPWFNSCATPEEYERRYHAEILCRLGAKQVAAELMALAGGKVPVLCCFERAGSGKWCHRALAAAWLAEALGEAVPELGHEDRPQNLHPLRAWQGVLFTA
jgi:hypothetical protein